MLQAIKTGTLTELQVRTLNIRYSLSNLKGARTQVLDDYVLNHGDNECTYSW